MKAYSYHTFILPFIWEKERTSCGKRLEEQYVEWQNKYRSDPAWEEMYVRSGDGINLCGISMEDYYKEYKYFHPHICEAIYGIPAAGRDVGTENSIVTCFSLRPDGRPLSGNYKIRRGDRAYTVDVYATEVRIYNTGIGLYSLKCRNTRPEQYNLEAVKDINDFGRRVTLPVLSNPVCADELCLELDSAGSFTENWSEIKARTAAGNLDSLSYISDIITGPMGISDTDISLGIDDRMFVLSWTTDAGKVKLFTGDGTGSEAYPYMTDEALSKDLYELAGVDSAGTCSCQSAEMRQELLEKFVYTRWLDYGSIYTIAAQGFNALSSADDEGGASYLPENFVTQYYQMSCLCLAQRTSLINFSRKAERISKGIEKRKDTIKRAQIQEMMDLQERYVAFITQIDATEASPEEQGIELYRMLRTCLNIETEKATLKEQLAGLNDLAGASQSLMFSKLGGMFGVAAFVLSIGNLLINGIPFGGGSADWGSIVLALLVAASALITWSKFSRRE